MEKLSDSVIYYIETMPDDVLEIAFREVIPFIGEGVIGGFIIGTLFSLAAFGVFKAISLLGIKNITR